MTRWRSPLATYRRGMRSGGLARRQLTPVTADRLLAAFLAAWALFDVPWWWRPPGHGGPELAILGVTALAAMQSVPFLWRRQHPTIVLAATAAALAVKFAVHLNLWSASAAVLTAAYGLGAHGSQPIRRATRVLVVVAVIAAIVSLQVGGGDHSAAIACALLATALAVGAITAAQRDLAMSLARQAHEQERADLAREIHDVVAHQLSAIAVQAGAARFASAANPQAPVAAVAAIEQGARAGLDELNTLVRRLRRTGAADSNGAYRLPDVQSGPQPRLHDVPSLVERAGECGLRAELVIDGQARPLADATELTGYRVVQEGLTNAIRYASGATATVRLRYSEAGILIEVADEGPAAGMGAHLAPREPAGQGGGSGLAGLSERARLLGGQFEAGQCQQGFVVRAFLPDNS
jgi:signal transduction histidine kinase